MGRQHTRDVVFEEGQDPVPCIVISRVKGRKGEEPVTLVIPMHPELQAELDLTPAGDMQFVVTSYGKAFSPAGFTSWFVEQAQAAGLQDRTPHGLRKAGSRRLAEGGAGAPQIRAVAATRAWPRSNATSLRRSSHGWQSWLWTPCRRVKREREVSNPMFEVSNRSQKHLN
jgi:hypothetical protein